MKKNQPADIWKFIDIIGVNECWNYTGGTFSGRYGRFFYDSKPHLAHRFLYFFLNPTGDESLFVMHKCNNKLCCNPSHLVTGTNSENQRHAITSKAYKPGASGIHGVSFDKARNYWRASGYEDGKARNLYTGPHKEKAIIARVKWEAIYGLTFKEK